MVKKTYDENHLHEFLRKMQRFFYIYFHFALNHKQKNWRSIIKCFPIDSEFDDKASYHSKQSHHIVLLLHLFFFTTKKIFMRCREKFSYMQKRTSKKAEHNVPSETTYSALPTSGWQICTHPNTNNVFCKTSFIFQTLYILDYISAI